ncbi:hypothetical protein ARALYDRAFT_497486, partial [Arabidopsis lyrata subsp. lyrata]
SWLIGPSVLQTYAPSVSWWTIKPSAYRTIHVSDLVVYHYDRPRSTNRLPVRSMVVITPSAYRSIHAIRTISLSHPRPMKSFVRRPLVCSRVQHPFCPLVLTVDFPVDCIHGRPLGVFGCTYPRASSNTFPLYAFPINFSTDDPIDPIIELSTRTINQVVEPFGGSHRILDHVIRHMIGWTHPIRLIHPSYTFHRTVGSGGSMRISSVETPRIHSDSGDTRRAAPPFRPTLRGEWVCFRNITSVRCTLPKGCIFPIVTVRPYPPFGQRSPSSVELSLVFSSPS